MVLYRTEMENWISDKSRRVIVSICNAMQDANLSEDTMNHLYTALHEELKILFFLHDQLENWNEDMVNAYSENPQAVQELLASFP